MKKVQPGHTRSPDSVQISISLPAKLLAKVDLLAEKEQRPRSNLIAYVLTREVENAGILDPHSSATRNGSTKK